MKHQALFSLKDKSKKLKCCLLHFFFCALSINKIVLAELQTVQTVIRLLHGEQSDLGLHCILTYVSSF